MTRSSCFVVCSEEGRTYMQEDGKTEPQGKAVINLSVSMNGEAEYAIRSAINAQSVPIKTLSI